MTLRKLMLPLTGTEAGSAALATAWTVAESFRAHLQVLHVRVDSRDVAPLAGEGLSGAMIEDMMTASEAQSTKRADSLQTLFSRFVQANAVPLETPAHDGDHASASFVTVTVTDALTAVIAVSPDPATGSAPFTVQFSDSGTVSTAQNTLTYSWSFGDGSAPNTNRAPSHTYATQGSFLVTLTVTDAYAQTASTSYTVIVNGSN